MTHVAEYKKRIVNEFVELMKEYPIVGAVNMENIPSPQLQSMRASLRDVVVLRMSKRRLMKIAIENAKKFKPGIEKIEEYLGGMPAILFTKENPFKLFSKLKKSKSTAPAKPGQVAPKEIVVKAGPTSFSPGPVISELSSCGIKTGVEAGKVVVKEDSVVAKEGEKIKPNVAGVLTRLGIEPMEVGLDLVAVYEDGVIYTKDVLDIDEEKFMQDLYNASSYSFNLAIEIAYPSKDTIEFLVGKAYNNAKALALGGDILCDATAETLLSKAEIQAKGLASELMLEVPVKEEKKKEPKEKEKKEEVKEEPKPEEKKEETKPKKEEPKAEEKEEEEPKVKYFDDEKKPSATEIVEDVEKEVAKEEEKEKKKEEPKEDVPKIADLDKKQNSEKQEGGK